MRVNTYFFVVALVMIILGVIIKPQYNNEVILGISIPWITSSLEFFLVNRAHDKKVQLTTKVLIYGFIIKMLVFGLFLSIIYYFYSFNPLVFVFSFLGSFFVFHTLEAFLLKSLFDHKNI
jgi:hypothetical protein